MSPDAQSNIRVFIRWDEQTVFAGEDIKCRITFRNVAPTATQQKTPQNPTERSRQQSPLVPSARAKPTTVVNPPPGGRSHRSTLSLNVPTNGNRSKSDSQPWVPPPPPPRKPGHAHQRSLSIVSLDSHQSADDQPVQGNGSPMRSQRPARGHGRSASLQIGSRGSGSISSPLSGGPVSAPFPRASPVFNNHSYPPTSLSFGRASVPSSVPSTAPQTPSIGSSRKHRKGSAAMPDFKFPMSPSPVSEAGSTATATPGRDPLASPISPAGGGAHLPVRLKDSVPTITENPAPTPAARVLAATSVAGGTPRSSGEFYTMSNNSSETLASEYPAGPIQGSRRPPYIRHHSGLSGISQARLPESLMMGFAQVQGSFTLDGSLINLGPFDEVKRKAVVGGQGGGVVGLEASKRGSLLRNFGWGSLGSSIGELLGGGELSSIREMRGAVNSKSIPLLSTPQSVLFIDLKLAPGESRSFEYSFKLPKGLPPTHKGKAMKISYSLVIGTQRPGGSREQQVRSVEIPFRVLGSVNSRGNILSHDLFNPYILLRDQAKVQTLGKGSAENGPPKKQKALEQDSSIQGLLSYVDQLLDRPRNGSVLMSPTMTASSSRRTSLVEDAGTAKEAIDLAIIRSNLTSENGQSSNRFEIARNSRRVGVIMLARPAYRLGESVNMVIDFSGAETPCYAVHAALETTESVDSSLALRSESSIHRVTRKVFGSSSEATLFAQRVVFNPTIPITATPEFNTSGLNLEWKVKIEFVVPSSTTGGDSHGSGGETPHHLLEEISRDDKGGLIMVAAEHLECESFEVAVPLRVYGAVCNGLERLERDEASEQGLVV